MKTDFENKTISCNLIRRGAINLNQSIKQFSFLLKNLEAVIFDCDGVLWKGMEPIPGAQELVNKLRFIGKKVFFLTNNSTKTRQELLEKFNQLGFQATLEEIIGTAYLAAFYLKERNFGGKVYVIGTRGIAMELDKVGIESLPIGPDNIPMEIQDWVSKEPSLDPEVQAVIVGFDHHFSYSKLIKAARYLSKPDCLFLATDSDERILSVADFFLPGAGCIVNAVKTVAQREPKDLGKPQSFPFEFIQKSDNLDPNRVLMIGDNAYTDIYFGNNCGLWTLLVLTGITSLDEIEKLKLSDNLNNTKCIPDFYLSGVTELLSVMNNL